MSENGSQHRYFLNVPHVMLMYRQGNTYQFKNIPTPGPGCFSCPASTFMPSVMPYLFSSHYVLVIILGSLLFRNKPKRENTDSSGSNENAATSIKLCLIPTMGKQSPLLNSPACLFDLGHAHPNEPILSHVQVHLHVPSSPLAHCQSLL